MKQIHFTHKERELLTPYVKQRLESYAIEFKDARKDLLKYYVYPLVTLVEKLNRDTAIEYSKNEMLFCMSCINEHIEWLRERVSTEKSCFGWLTTSDQEWVLLLDIDAAYSILEKVGYFKGKQNVPTPYSTIKDNIQKIRTSDTICLSKTGEFNFYKVAFIYNLSEYFNIELSNDINLKQLRFASMNNIDVKEFLTTRYSMTTDRNTALILLSKSEEKYCYNETLSFVKNVLN